MSDQPQLTTAVVRLHVGSILALALVLLLVGPTLAAMALVERDDADAVALARTLGSELTHHADDPTDAQDALIRRERREQLWFGRVLGVWQGGEPIGAGRREALLSPWVDEAPGCRMGRPATVWMRVCTVPVDPWVLVVATPALPLLMSLSQLVAVLAGLAALATVLVTVMSESLIRHALAPLSRFDRAVADFSPVGAARLPVRWGAAEIDELAQTFNALLQRVDVAVAQERRFVADAAHELRTPLTRLWGAIDLAAGEATGTSADRLQAASRSCGELADTLEALLALSRDVADGQEVIELHDLCADALARLPAKATARVGLESGADTAVRGDPVLLRLAVSNLVDNALKYTTGPVGISVHRRDGAVELAVSDEGPGLTEEERHTVLEPFVRGPGAMGVHGSGIGLALVSHVAKLHAGSLTLGTRSGRGLVASLSLPGWVAR